MAPTNADRPAPLMARSEQGALPESIGARFRKIVDRAVETLWTVYNRPAPDGSGWAEVEGLGTLEDYRRHLAAAPALLVDSCRDLLWASHMLLDEEKLVLETVVEISDALALRRP